VAYVEMCPICRLINATLTNITHTTARKSEPVPTWKNTNVTPLKSRDIGDNAPQTLTPLRFECHKPGVTVNDTRDTNP